MAEPKVGCLCVSAPRMPLLPIAMESFAAQTYENRELLVLPYTPRDKVLEKLDLGCEFLFGAVGCDYVAMWDDDDYHPPRALEFAVEVLGRTWPSVGAGVGIVAGYTAGWYVNVKTLRAEYVDCEPLGHLWGASLVFDEWAWDDFDFMDQAFPGYDKALQEHAGDVRPIAALKTELPVAFVHGKNVATHMSGPGAFTEGWRGSMSERVEQAVWTAHRFFNDNDIHVPCPEVPL